MKGRGQLGALEPALPLSGAGPRAGKAARGGAGRGLEGRARGAGQEAGQPAGRRASPALRAHVTGPRGPALADVQASEDGG